jgi:1-pyrroline-4-hydroxy-2-carboxylate deaminase
MAISWRGVFPAVTTQFKDDYAVDMEATRRSIQALLRDGVGGLIVLGTVGENGSLTADEKRSVLALAVETVGRRVPVVAGAAEMTTDAACRFARDAKRIGVDGLMTMPAVGYPAKPRETLAHFRAIAAATDLPIMLYNNPPVYRTDVTADMIVKLADCATIVAVKESSGDMPRYTDIRNATGDRFTLFCGLDTVVLESVLLGCVGWVSGMSNIFPVEGNRLFDLALAGRYAEARRIYDWFMPLLHLDARPDLVQCIKFCEQMAGRGHERTRPPRLALEGAERAHVEALMKKAMAERPKLKLAA